MEKCLGKNCPNHCCSNKFKGLSAALKNDDSSKFVQIQLDNEEVKRIVDKGRVDLIEFKNGNYFIKLNNDFSCSALVEGNCSIYDIRPNVCKLYPYYFDPFCGLCIDKNCPGNFDLDIPQNALYDLLNKRINLYSNSQHFFFDGYDIDNKILGDIDYITKFINEVNDIISTNNVKTIFIPYFNGKIKKDGGISVIILGDNFHFTCHTFCYKKTIFIDCYDKNNVNKDLLNIVTKYFRTDNFDLCTNNSDKKGNFGKHIIMKNIKPISYNNAKDLINNIVDSIEMTTISDLQINYRDDFNYDILQPIAESHISIHNTEKSCDVDIFSCKYFDENKILKTLGGNTENMTQIQRGIYYK